MSTTATLLCCLVILACALVPGSARASGDTAAVPTPASLAEYWTQHRLPLPNTPLVTHEVVAAQLDALLPTFDERFGVSREVIGTSIEGRAIWHVTIGRGPTHVLLWSQMHGDEASATSALFDLLVYIREQRVWLDQLTLHIVPMLNPDGAQRFQRRNAQGIDINRDAARLQTPESRALMALRDRVTPAVGFNLHNQNWQTSVGRPPQPAAISLLSVAYDEPRSVNAGRMLTKRLGAIVRDALEPLAAGRLGRYDDEFEPRAFGDLVTKAGTPVLLIETGPWPGAWEEADRTLVQLNFVALVSALDALATGRVAKAAVARYDSLPENEGRMLHTVIRNATVKVDADVPTFVGDIGVVVSRRVVEQGGQRTVVQAGRVEDLGDLSVYGALNVIDAQRQVVAPVFNPAAQPGDRVVIPTGQKIRNPIALGAPATFWLLEPLEGEGVYRLVRVITIP